MTTLPEPYDAYCARRADEHAAEAGWTEGDLDDDLDQDLEDEKHQERRWHATY